MIPCLHSFPAKYTTSTHTYIPSYQSISRSLVIINSNPSYERELRCGVREPYTLVQSQIGCACLAKEIYIWKSHFFFSKKVDPYLFEELEVGESEARPLSDSRFLFDAFYVDVTQELRKQNNDTRFPNQYYLVCLGDQINFREDTNNHA